MASIIVKRQLRQVCLWIIELAGEEACEGSLISVFALVKLVLYGITLVAIVTQRFVVLRVLRKT
jgi:hypothetical protein